MTIRSFPQGDASSLFAQDDSGCFAQDDSGCFAQDDSRDFAPCDEEVVIKPPKRESAPFSVW